MVVRLPKEMIERIEKRLRAERRFSPCVDQTREQIEDYYRNAPVGSDAVIRHYVGGQLRYEVRKITGRNNRHVIVQGKAFTMKSGIAYDRRPYTTYLVVPTQAVLDWAAAHLGPLDGFGVSIYRHEARSFR